MTVKELYQWAVENGIEDAEIAVQYRDGGGYYSGIDDNISPETEEHYGSVMVIL